MTTARIRFHCAFLIGHFLFRANKSQPVPYGKSPATRQAPNHSSLPTGYRNRPPSMYGKSKRPTVCVAKKYHMPNKRR